jgi:uncharacterized membrane protein YfcA
VSVVTLILAALGLITVAFIVGWILLERAHGTSVREVVPTAGELVLGFLTNFFDTLGIGSFAPTTAVFKFFGMVPDEKIPGTLNVGHTLPTLAEAVLFIAAVTVAPLTLVGMIAASVVGAWIGAGIVPGLPRRTIQLWMGVALFVAASLFAIKNLENTPYLSWFPKGGDAVALSGTGLVIGLVGNFVLGVLMMLGIGLYGPCMILVSLLGMSPITAFPIMMGSCAFLMPISSVRFVQKRGYSPRAAVGLGIAGVPGVLLAVYIVKSLPLTVIRWGVVVVVLYTAVAMLYSAFRTAPASPGLSPAPGQAP